MDKQPDERQRVAISSRFFPLASYAIAALGGAIGSIYMLQVISAVRNSAEQGIGGIASGLSTGGALVNVALMLALLVGFVGIVTTIVRLFMTTAKASAPAWIFLLPGILAIFPPVSVYLSAKALIDPMLDRDAPTVPLEQLASYVTMLSIASIVCGVIAILASLALAFAPLSSVRNKKFGAVVLLLILELAFLFIIGAMYVRNRYINNVYGYRGWTATQTIPKA